MMKKILIAALWLLLAVVASAQTKEVYRLRISAKDNSLQNEWALLLDQDKTIDSVRIGPQGANFVGQVDLGALYTVRVGKYQIMFIPEKGNLRADIVKDDYAVGSPSNDELSKLVATTRVMIDAFRAKVQQFNANATMSPEEKQRNIEDLSQSVEREYKKIYLDAFRKHPNHAIGYVALESLGSVIGAEEFMTLYDQAGERVKSYRSLKRSYQLSINAVKTSAGRPFVNIVGVNPRDTTQSVHLADYVGKGKYVVVDFWASWCGPCRREMPTLKQAYEKYRHKALEIVGVGVWDKHADNINAIDQMQLPWPMLYDMTQRTCADSYGLMGIPTVILFDKDGNIISRDLRGEDLMHKLDELLQ